jgi:hypothetical protein
VAHPAKTDILTTTLSPIVPRNFEFFTTILQSFSCASINAH